MGKNVSFSGLGQVSSCIDKANQHRGLYFKDTFDAQGLSKIFEKNLSVEIRDRIFSPVVTLLAFLQQVLSPDRSCRGAVAHVNAERIAAGKLPASSDTGGYCKARMRLPLEACSQMLKHRLWKLRYLTNGCGKADT